MSQEAHATPTSKFRFETYAKPDWIGICHCLDCQKVSGGPYQYLFVFSKNPEEAFVLTTGNAKELVPGMTWKGAYINYRCDACNSLVYCDKIAKNQDGKVEIKGRDTLVGNLDKEPLAAAGYKPSCHIFYQRRVFDVHDGVDKFIGMWERKVSDLGEDL
ncbi:hypothetical protein HDU91_005055 [Kappamyces sp. JEL0680]|nr:hypothetical protein HDU91_005055 [Kappamyces sp. JEL0680]